MKKVVVAKGRLVSRRRAHECWTRIVTRRELLALVPAVGRRRVRLLAGRPRVVPAGLHPHHRHSRRSATRTPYPTVEQMFTEKVRVEFQSRGQYTVIPTEAGADGVVRGTITGISAAPVGFTDAQLARRYRFTVIVGV